MACASSAKKQAGRTHAGRYFRPSAQQPLSLVETLRATSGVPCAAGPCPVHDQAGTRCSSPERGTMPGNAQGCSLGPHSQTCHQVLAGQLDTDMARRSHHVRLYVCARGTSSWPGNHARPATGLSATRQGRLWHLALGKTLETVRVGHAPQMSKFRVRRPPGLLGRLPPSSESENPPHEAQAHIPRIQLIGR